MRSIRASGKDAYMRLVRRFPLVVIRNEQQLDTALEIIDELLDRSNLTAEESDYLSILTEQVRHFEQRSYPALDLPPVELLKYLMECNGLRASDLAPLFGSKSVLSEVLNGKRQLSKTHIANLAERFSLSPAVFFFHRAVS